MKNRCAEWVARRVDASVLKRPVKVPTRSQHHRKQSVDAQQDGSLPSIDRSIATEEFSGSAQMGQMTEDKK
jgi:hypothetical protein